MIAISAITFLPAQARGNEHDGQVWMKIGASTQISEIVDLKLETNQRFSNDRGGLYESQYLVAFAAELAKGVTVTAGINRVVSLDNGVIQNTEWRPRQQIDFPVGKVGAGQLKARVRLEQRFRSDDDETGHTVRPQISYSIPVRKDLKIELAHESYFNFNSTDQQDAGHERMRNSATLTFPLAGELEAEIGYMNQFRFNRDKRDLMEHALTANLAINF